MEQKVGVSLHQPKSNLLLSLAIVLTIPSCQKEHISRYVPCKLIDLIQEQFNKWETLIH